MASRNIEVKICMYKPNMCVFRHYLSYMYRLGNWGPERPILSLSGEARVETMSVRLTNSYHYSRLYTVDIWRYKVKEYPTNVERPSVWKVCSAEVVSSSLVMKK